MFEAVEGAFVAERKSVGLGLKTDLHRVEGIFNIFPCYTCNLIEGERGVSRFTK